MNDANDSPASTRPTSTPPSAQPAPTAAPAPESKTLTEWYELKGRHWLHGSACILAGWTAAQRLHAAPLTYTEAEYDAGLKLAGDNPLG